jgi:hypothetical protein
MCTYVGCPTANELYGTRAEWLAHEQELHQLVWKCRDHPTLAHESREDFQNHMDTVHPGLTIREIEISSDYSKETLSDTRTHCRICLVDVLRLPHLQTLVNHMAHHFETFARLSFPVLEGNDDDHKSGHDEDESSCDDALDLPDFDDLSDVSSDMFEDEPTTLDESNIHALAVNGNKHGMRALLDSNLDVDVEDNDGCTALQKAAYGGHRAISQMLLDAGADVNHPGGNLHGNALQCAVRQGHGRLVQLLIDNGANVNQQRGISGSALQAAASQGHECIVESLLRAGADVNTTGGVHTTALEAATANGYENIARILTAGVKVDGTGAPGPSQHPAELLHSGSDGPSNVSAASKSAAVSTQRGVQWVFDQQLKQYYFYDAAKHEIVYQNGTRRQAPTRPAYAVHPRPSESDSSMSSQHTPKTVSALQDGPAWVFDQQLKQYFYYDAASRELVYQNGTRRQAPNRVAASPRAAVGTSRPNMTFQYTPNQTNSAYNIVAPGPSQQSTANLSGARQSLPLRSAGSSETSGASGMVPTAPRFDAPRDPLASATTRPLDSGNDHSDQYRIILLTDCESLQTTRKKVFLLGQGTYNRFDT